MSVLVPRRTNRENGSLHVPSPTGTVVSVTVSAACEPMVMRAAARPMFVTVTREQRVQIPKMCVEIILSRTGTPTEEETIGHSMQSKSGRKNRGVT